MDPSKLEVARYLGSLTDNLFAEVQWSKKTFTFQNSNLDNGLEESSPFLSNTTSPFVHYHAPYFDGTDPEDRDNQQITGSLSWFADTEKLGSHDVKFGVEDFTSKRTGGNSQSPTDFVFQTDPLQNPDGSYVVDDNDRLIPTFVPGQSLILNWLPTRGAKVEINTRSAFVNDRWRLNKHWSFNLGARYEQVNGEATGGITTVDTSAIVPRLGASFDPRGDGEFRFDATYAQYAGKYSEAQFAENTTVGNPRLLAGFYVGPEGQGNDFAPGFDPNNYVTFFANDGTANVRVANDIHSPVVDEITLSGGMQLSHGGYLKLIYTDRSYSDFVEDFLCSSAAGVPCPGPGDTGTTFVSVEGVDAGEFNNTVIDNSNEPERKYRALQLLGRYQFTPKWTVNGNWTYQLKNNGNFEGEGTNTPGISSTFGDFPGVFVASRHFPTGKLDDYQAHKVRLWSTYLLGMGRFGQLATTVLANYNSGTTFSFTDSIALPFSAEQDRILGFYNSSPGSTQSVFFGKRGAGTFPSSLTFDLGLFYELPGLEASGDVRQDGRLQHLERRPADRVHGEHHRQHRRPGRPVRAADPVHACGQLQGPDRQRQLRAASGNPARRGLPALIVVRRRTPEGRLRPPLFHPLRVPSGHSRSQRQGERATMRYPSSETKTPGRIVLRAIVAALVACLSTLPAAAAEPEDVHPAGWWLAHGDVPALQELLRSGELRAEALTRAALARIEALDGELHAVVAVDPTALDQARALDRELAERGPRGPLHGIPVLIKDNIETADQPTTAGSLALAGNETGRDAPLVARLRKAGAVILGKANLSEWANFRSERSSSGWSGLRGQTRNPLDPTRSPCGSSSGSAAGVAAGYVLLAVGTETNGSIVCPASANGVVGIKPTVGLVSRTHVVPISHSQDTAGPLARSVTSAVVLLQAMIGADPADPASEAAAPYLHRDLTAHLRADGLQGKRIGVVRSEAGFHPEVDALFDHAIEALRAAGATVVDKLELEEPDGFEKATFDVLLYEFKHDLNAYLAGLPDAELLPAHPRAAHRLRPGARRPGDALVRPGDLSPGPEDRGARLRGLPQGARPRPEGDSRRRDRPVDPGAPARRPDRADRRPRLEDRPGRRRPLRRRQLDLSGGRRLPGRHGAHGERPRPAGGAVDLRPRLLRADPDRDRLRLRTDPLRRHPRGWLLGPAQGLLPAPRAQWRNPRTARD